VIAETSRRTLAASEANASRSSVVVALSFLVGTALSGLLGVVIGLVLGEGPDTDAFLSAFSVYLVFLLFGANLRTALLPLIGSGQDDEQLRARAADVLERIGTIGVAVAALVAVLSPLAGWVLTARAHGGGFGTAAGTLAILAPAVFCQVLGAAQSAVLAAGRRFNVSAALYIASSTVTVVLATGLMFAMGPLGAAVGMLGGAAVLAGGHVVYLHRFGVVAHPRPGHLRERTTYRLAASALGGASLPLAFQVNLTIALAAVTGVVGVVTAYTYGYFVPVLLTSLTAASIGFVSMPQLVADIHHRGAASAATYARTLAPLGAFLYAPVAAATAALGRPLIDAVLDGPLSTATVDLLWDILRIFLLMGAGWVLFAPVPTAALALRRYRQLATIAVSSMVIQAVALPIAAGHGPQAAAATHAAIGVLIVVSVVVDVFRRDAGRLAGVMLWRSLPAAGLALVFPALAAVTPEGWAAHLAAAIAGFVLYTALAIALWPDVRRPVLALRSAVT
jgi:O-antigen/teichoic acid export membrane protein